MSRISLRFTTAALAALFVLALVLTAEFEARAQSGATRPRRVTPSQPVPTPSPVGQPNNNASTPAPARASAPRTTAATPRTAPASAAATSGSPDTSRAFALLQQKQYEAALREARQVTASDPSNSEGWKIAGFAEMNLRQYAEASADLQRALDLQRAAGAEDANTLDALAQAYVRTEKFEQALPLLVAATSRTGAQPDALMLYYRGLAEFRTGKMAEAERSLNQAVKADPKSAPALFYLGRIAFERKDNDAAINALNRATLSDPRLAEAWTLLTYAYLRRADASADAKADADYLSAVRASEGLTRVRTDEVAFALHGQALIRAKLYPRAALALERVAASSNVQGSTLYLLGIAHSRAKNFPKAITALERAAAKTPDDVNIYRELGYVYEVSKQYAKALTAYEKGLSLVPDDADFKEAAERVRPFAK
ncbi:MAG TPA: tetratricopeptide repeat protein [Pyrinomonadaceae bacterium]|jgi:tetratricopeptide (TPR) repeat protein